MKRSWREKLDEKGLKIVELSAALREVRPLATIDFREISRWLREQKAVFADYPELEEKRKAMIDPKFIPLYLSAHPEIELNTEQLQYMFEHEEFNVLRAEELELTERIALVLEADVSKRIQAYEAVAGAILLLRAMLSGGLKKQLGTRARTPFAVVRAIAQNLSWMAEMLNGKIKESPGRFNVELATLANSILEHQKEPLTQLDLYDALAAAGATLPEDPEAFRLWLHRARKQGLVSNLHPKSS